MKKILLIGQEYCSISDIRQWGQVLGYNLEVVSTGNAAINKLTKMHYDIVMTSDVSDDHIDGNTIAYWLKSRNGRPPMIIGFSDNPWFFDPELFDGIYSSFLDFYEIKDIITKIDLHLGLV